MPSPVSTTLKAFSHVLDERHVIDRVGKTAAWTLGIGAPASLMAWNASHAEPDKRKQVLIRDGLVLGGVALTSIFAVRKYLMGDVLENGVKVGKSFVKQKTVNEAREELLEGFAKVKSSVKYQAYKALPKLEALVLKENKSLADYKAIITHMKTASPGTYKEDINKLLPVDLGDDCPTKLKDVPEFLGNLWKELSNFAVLGTVPIFGGIMGGLAANKINGERGKTADMVKEGVFQLISNIVLPVITGAVGITLMSIPTIKRGLEKIPNAARLIRFGVVGISITAGIASGMLLANKIGEKWLTPMFNRMQGKPSKPPSADGRHERKPDFFDIFLHVDDLPVALSVAGVAILEPFLPFLFGITGWRAGVGFRNGESLGEANEELDSKPAHSPSKRASIPPEISVLPSLKPLPGPAESASSLSSRERYSPPHMHQGASDASLPAAISAHSPAVIGTTPSPFAQPAQLPFTLSRLPAGMPQPTPPQAPAIQN
jgi:hypothetical protein